MVVRSLAVLFPEFESPPPATTATLVTLGGALGATLTVSVIGEWFAPAASVSERSQLSDASVHVQPDPARPVGDSADGSVSVTVTLPLVDPGPALLTVSE